MNQEDRLCLARIRENYGPAITEAGEHYGWRPAVLAGIMMRETRGGESKLLKDSDGIQDGNPADDTGDAGHGHGLMQIDDRSFPAFCQSEEWKDPAKNIEFGARVLDGKRRFLSRAGVPDELIERAAIAAYNCGEGNVLKAYRAGEDLDSRTAGRNYSKNVLEFAEAYGGQS